MAGFSMQEEALWFFQHLIDFLGHPVSEARRLPLVLRSACTACERSNRPSRCLVAGLVRRSPPCEDELGIGPARDPPAVRSYVGANLLVVYSGRTGYCAEILRPPPSATLRLA